MIQEELTALVDKDEQILWSGIPNKLCYILEGIFNPLLPFALIWGAFDFGFLSLFFSSSNIQQDTNIPIQLPIFMILFFAIHLMPVWIYLAGCLMIFRKYKNTGYIVTDKAIYISGGFLSYTITRKPFAELSHIDLHRGIFDQMLGVGDVVATSSQNVLDVVNRYNKFNGMQISDISDYLEVYKLVKQLQTDIYSDIMYPNDLRPEENHGYQTKYIRPEDTK